MWPRLSLAIAWLCACAVAVLSVQTFAQAPEKPPAQSSEKPPSDKPSGDKPADEPLPICVKCHKEAWEGGFSQTKHAVRGDLRTPFGTGRDCQACHGDATEHLKNPVKNPIPERFGRQGPADAQNQVCLTCHKDQRAYINRPSRHPIREGKVTCSDCHNTHGTVGPAMVTRDTISDTCYTCHMEKRGPFVRNHPPVQENCAICHNPHGSTNPSLLRVRLPYLCQECHEPTSHRGTAPTVAGTGTGTNRAVILARGCANCHTNIHGSNNPAPTTNERSFRR